MSEIILKDVVGTNEYLYDDGYGLLMLVSATIDGHPALAHIHDWDHIEQSFVVLVDEDGEEIGEDIPLSANIIEGYEKGRHHFTLA